MKYDAIVGQGIPIHERVPIPDEMIPEDSRVEIDAKIHAGSVKNPLPCVLGSARVTRSSLPDVGTLPLVRC
jgi:hypothetical protein